MIDPIVAKLWWSTAVVLILSLLSGSTFISVSLDKNPPKWKVICKDICSMLAGISVILIGMLSIIAIWQSK